MYVENCWHKGLGEWIDKRLMNTIIQVSFGTNYSCRLVTKSLVLNKIKKDKEIIKKRNKNNKEINKRNK